MSNPSSSSKADKVRQLLNRKRKQTCSTKTTEQENKSDFESLPTSSNIQEEEVNKKNNAAEEKTDAEEKARNSLLLDAKMAKRRAETVGPQGWLKPRSLSTNKNFLSRTLQSTLTKSQKRDNANN